MSPPSSARRRWRRSTTTTSGASSTSTPTCRAAIWGGRPRHRAHRRCQPSPSAARQLRHRARPARNHARCLCEPARRPRLFDPAGLSADRGELPVLARPVHHHHRPAGGAGRHRAVPVLHRNDAQRAGADGRHHVHGRRHRQQHPDGVVCPRAARRPWRFGAGRDRSRASPASVRC